MPKYSFTDTARSYWIFPDGKEISKSGVYSHDDLLEEMDGKALDYDCAEGSHGEAFDLGFLRVTVISNEPGELNLQWASLLTAFQRRRAAELAEGCGRVEISGADEGYDPEGNYANLSLEASDSRFKRNFAAGLRREHSEWVDNYEE